MPKLSLICTTLSLYLIAIIFKSQPVESASATETKLKPGSFHESFSTRRKVTPSPLPCILGLDDPLCPFEDTFKKFNRNFWLRANNYARKPTTAYSCWLSKSNAKRIPKKKAPNGAVKIMIKNKPNKFDGLFVPFSCGEIFSRKRFGIGCYEAEMQPKLFYG